MALITEPYRELQRELHARLRYGNYGHRWADRVRALLASHDCKTVLDYGCGRFILHLHHRRPDQTPKPVLSSVTL